MLLLPTPLVLSLLPLPLMDDSPSSSFPLRLCLLPALTAATCLEDLDGEEVFDEGGAAAVGEPLSSAKASFLAGGCGERWRSYEITVGRSHYIRNVFLQCNYMRYPLLRRAIL